MPTRPADIIRPLGAVEEFLWLFDHSSPKHFCIIAEVTGRAPASEWRNALDTLQRRHPMLSVSIDTTYNRVPHFRRRGDQLIPLRVASSHTTWEREVEQEMRTLFDPTEAPLVRAVLISEPQSSFIILVTHHSIADGMASVFLLRDLLKALSGEELGQYPFPQSLDELCGLPVRTSSDAGVSFRHELAREFVTAPVHVKSSVFSPELTDALKQRVRQEQTTIQSIICAAITLAGREINPPWRDAPFRIFTPVDVRRLVGLEDQCMVAFSKARTVIAEDATTDIWELARFIRTTLAPFKTSETNVPVLNSIATAMASNMDVEDGARFNYQTFSEEVMVSNVGIVPYSPQFGDLTIKSLWAPVMLRGHRPEQTIGVATVNGSIHLVHSSWNPIPGLLESVETILIKSCSV